MAVANSSVAMRLLEILSPTLDYHEGPLGHLPICDSNDCSAVEMAVESCVSFSKYDYDSLETSWDFKRSPLL